MGSSQLELSGSDVIRDHLGEAPGLREREEVELAMRKQDGSSRSSRDKIQTQALASFSASGYSVWGSGVLKFCRLQVRDNGKTVMVVITAGGNWLL